MGGKREWNGSRVGAGEVWMRGGGPCGRTWVGKHVCHYPTNEEKGTAAARKQPHSTPNHPCPYASPVRFVRLMRITADLSAPRLLADKSAVGAINRPLRSFAYTRFNEHS